MSTCKELSDAERNGITEILHLLHVDDLYRLAKTVRKRKREFADRDEAVVWILTYEKSAEELLKRQKIGHDILFHYLCQQHVPVDAKVDVRVQILQLWGSTRGDNNNLLSAGGMQGKVKDEPESADNPINSMLHNMSIKEKKQDRRDSTGPYSACASDYGQSNISSHGGCLMKSDETKVKSPGPSNTPSRIIGTALPGSSGVKAVVKKEQCFVGQLDAKTTEEDVKKLLERSVNILKVHVIPLEKKEKWHEESAAFKIQFPIEYKERIFDPSIWPKGAVVRDWSSK